MHLTASAHGRATADEAWSRYAEPARWPQWAPQIRTVVASTPRLTAGTTGRVVGPCGVSVPFRVTAVDETRRVWSWRVHLGPVTISFDHGIENEADGIRTWIRIHAPLVLLPLMAGYLPIAQIALQRLVRPAT